VGCARSEHGGSILGPGTVVESEHHLAIPEEVVRLEMLEPESGAAGGIDFHHT
jgi:hypothetical protein